MMFVLHEANGDRIVTFTDGRMFRVKAEALGPVMFLNTDKVLKAVLDVRLDVREVLREQASMGAMINATAV